MTPEQIILVQTSFEKVRPMSDTVAELFYGRLFELDPAARTLFKGDMQEQGRKLMATLALVAASLNKLDDLVPAVQALGKRHAGYGVQNSHYDTVGSALLWTLGQGLGEKFTPEVQLAWTEAYILLSGVMKEAAASIAQPV